MKTTTVWILLALLSIPSIATYAAEYPDWEGFPPMATVHDVVAFNDVLYAASLGGLFKYDPATGEYTYYYKNNGLLSNNVRAIAATSRYLYLGFEEYGLVRFDPETEQSEQILFPEYVTSEKTIRINAIYPIDDDVLLIAHQEGVDRLNLSTSELETFRKHGDEENIIENQEFYAVTVARGKIWACSNGRVAVADVDDPNLELPGAWRNYYFKDKPVLSVANAVDNWEDVMLFGTFGYGILYLNEENDRLEQVSGMSSGVGYKITVNDGFTYAAMDDGLARKYSKLWSLYNTEYDDIRSVTAGSDGTLWVGTLHHGIVPFVDKEYGEIQLVDGPRLIDYTDISIDTRKRVWITAGYRQVNWDNVLPDAIILTKDNPGWTEFGENDGYKRFIMTVHTDRTGKKWFGSWGQGLYVLDDMGTDTKEDDVTERVNPQQDVIQFTIGRNFVVIPDITEDRHGNIWVAVHQTEKDATSGVVVLDGYPYTKHQTYSVVEDGITSSEIISIHADDDGWVWIGTTDYGLSGIYVGDDPFDKSDTVVRNLTIFDGLLKNEITAIGSDSEGIVWAGSLAGINRIQKLSGNKLKVDDYNAVLDGAIPEVRSIVVDPHDNKWFGTQNMGVVQIDANNSLGSVHNYLNSGIFSNYVYALAYDTDDDVLWIGTDAGLNKFYTVGNNGQDAFDGIHSYPNPFELWGSNSRMTFAGLEMDSEVRIYSFDGTNVSILTADQAGQLGGAAVEWDGRNLRGEMVATGVYFFTGTDRNGRDFQEKMVVIRR